MPTECPDKGAPVRVDEVPSPKRRRHPAIGKTIAVPVDVIRLFADLRTAEQEATWVLGLNARHTVKTAELVALGTANRVHVAPRDVFRALIRKNCTGFILIHNHASSGFASPSAEDDVLTSSMHEAASLLGIELVDHLIIGRESHYTYAGEGRLATFRSR